MKKFFEILGTCFLVVIGFICILIFALFYFLIKGINWILYKIFKKKEMIPIDKWLDKLFSSDEYEYFEE